jgi:hypothetical protein
MSLLGPRPRTDPAVARRIRAWAREVFALAPESAVTVKELRCAEPDCPDVETVVIVSPPWGPTFQRKFAMPAADVTRTHLQGAADQ